MKESPSMTNSWIPTSLANWKPKPLTPKKKRKTKALAQESMAKNSQACFLLCSENSPSTLTLKNGAEGGIHLASKSWWIGTVRTNLQPHIHQIKVGCNLSKENGNFDYLLKYFIFIFIKVISCTLRQFIFLKKEEAQPNVPKFA